MRLALNPKRQPFSQPASRGLSTQCSSSSSSSSSTRSLNRVRIGRRWMEYQGANNWDGLLDPLDATLRSELLRYGKFVQAAYNCFDFDPSSPSYATCRFPKHSLLPLSGLTDSGYRVTRNLHVTSGIHLPRWTTDRAPPWVSNKSSWIGYVAVCDDEREIARLGRRDVVVAYRGTATCLEWLENLRATLTRVPGAMPNGEFGPMVESGFWSLYTSAGVAYRSLQAQIKEEVTRLLNTYGGGRQPLSLTVTGHSLGAALAVLTAYDITSTFRESPLVTVISFGGPRVGNARFRRHVEERGNKGLRIVNTGDIITKVPGFVLDDDRPGVADGRKLSTWLKRTGWVYSDVGRELRVSSRTANVAACHDLNLYLHLVKQLSATCPFRTRPKQDSWSPLATTQ